MLAIYEQSKFDRNRFHPLSLSSLLVTTGDKPTVIAVCGFHLADRIFYNRSIDSYSSVTRSESYEARFANSGNAFSHKMYYNC